MADALAALLSKARSIGPPKPGQETPLPTPAEEADPIRKFLSLLTDPLGLGQPDKIMGAGIGGLPEGLNAHAIAEMLKREGLQLGEDPHALVTAAKAVAQKIAPSLRPLLTR